MQAFSSIGWPFVALVVILLGVFLYFRLTPASVGLEEGYKLLGRKAFLYIYTTILWGLALWIVLSKIAGGDASASKDILDVFGDTLLFLFLVAVGGNSFEWGSRAYAAKHGKSLEKPVA